MWCKPNSFKIQFSVLWSIKWSWVYKCPLSMLYCFKMSVINKAVDNWLFDINPDNRDNWIIAISSFLILPFLISFAKSSIILFAFSLAELLVEFE